MFEHPRKSVRVHTGDKIGNVYLVTHYSKKYTSLCPGNDRQHSEDLDRCLEGQSLCLPSWAAIWGTLASWIWKLRRIQPGIDIKHERFYVAHFVHIVYTFF